MKRSAQRTKKFEKKLRASVGLRSVLEELAVQPATSKDYHRRLDEFWGFAARHRLRVKTPDELDVALVEYADSMFLDGEGFHVGEKLVAAFESRAIERTSDGVLRAPRFRKVIKSWKKNAPSQSRLPMPEVFMWAVAGLLLARGHKEMSLYSVGLYSTYLRPSALRQVLAVGVVAPTVEVSSGKYVIVIAPFEREVATKTGFYDETVILDDSQAPWLGARLHELGQAKLQEAGEVGEDEDEVELWSFNPRTFLSEWREAVASLGLEFCLETPYQSRHGGASRDYLEKRRSAVEIQLRGHWASTSSMRIYNKPGRLQQSINRARESVVQFGKLTKQHFNEWYRAGTLPQEARAVLLAAVSS